MAICSANRGTCPWTRTCRPTSRRLRLHRGGRANATTAGLFFRCGVGLRRGAERGRQAIGVEANALLTGILHLGRAFATRTTATAGCFLLGLGCRDDLRVHGGGGDGRLGVLGHDGLFGAHRAAILARLAPGTFVAVAARTVLALLRVALIILAWLALATRLLDLTLLLAGADGIALVAIILGIVVEAVVILVVARFLALAALILLLEARAGFAQHPEIVVGELPVIFGVDPVALALRLGRQILVLLVQLVGVAARAVIDAIAIVGTAGVATRTLPTIVVAATTATAAGLPIIDQAVRP